MADEKRLIDANALKDALSNLEVLGGHKYYRNGMDDALHFHMPNIIDDALTVDAVEVVRCKDCRSGSRNTPDGFHWPDGFAWCTRCKIMMNSCDFCSYGERKDNDG